MPVSRLLLAARSARDDTKRFRTPVGPDFSLRRRPSYRRYAACLIFFLSRCALGEKQSEQTANFRQKIPSRRGSEYRAICLLMPYFPSNVRLTRPRLISGLIFLFACTLLAQDANQQGAAKEAPKVEWQHGPFKASLGDQAAIEVPEGYVFADAANTAKFLEATENIPSGNELGTIASAMDHWFAVFEFENVGYVKDDEKDKLDADMILKQIKDATEAANEERKKRGWGAFHVTGWITPPHYDTETNQLIWSIVGRDDAGGRSANYRTRLLGRRGVMSVGLVVEPNLLEASLPTFTRVISRGFSYTPENRYSAFVKGDKVAEYGLGALIVGGAAAAAVKTGLMKYFVKLLIAGWKLVIAAMAAVVAFLRRVLSGRKQSQSAEPSELQSSE